MQRLLIFLWLGLAFLLVKIDGFAYYIPKDIFEEFKAQIKKDLKGKVPEEYVEKIFSSPKLEYYPNIMIRSLTWKESKLPYHRFIEPYKIQMAKEFLEKHYELLEEIEQKFGVEKEILVGLFLVETNFGKYTGKWPVLNVFYSMAISGNKKVFFPYAKDANISLENPAIKKRWKRRSKWAYKELLYFIEICYKYGFDPFEIKGSIFGAFGYPQFVPRSYLIYGYDWNKDGFVDLFNLEDALASMANYLKKEGYKKSASKEEKMRVIMKYNKSKIYAETVLTIAEELRRLQKKD